MQIFDFNIHLPFTPANDVTKIITADTLMDAEALAVRYSHYRDHFRQTIRSGNFMLFNQNLFDDPSSRKFFESVAQDFPTALFTALIDFRKTDVTEYIDAAVEQGIRGITFHSYIQQIPEARFEDVRKVCMYAQEKGLFISLDTSYGTTRMYEYDNLKMAAFLLEDITRVPVIFVHSGGLRILEAMLLADLRPNVFLETSFSLDYFAGSSLMKDFAFAYKKIGTHRVLYGSDFPYVSFNDALKTINNLFESYRFTDREIEDVMFNNAAGLCY